MVITGAMLTASPQRIEDQSHGLRRWLHTRMRGHVPSTPTCMVLHIQGAGPRRVYKSSHTGKDFIRLNNRPKRLDETHNKIIYEMLKGELAA